jgi:methionyl aminopeptidase
VIQLKSAREIDLMAQGGKVLAAAVETLRAAVHPGISTGELDRIGEEFIRSHEGAVPAFKGLYGFPGSICASVNNEIVHGIPSASATKAISPIARRRFPSVRSARTPASCSP